MNARSPYTLLEDGEYGFLFVTEQGLHYRCGFKPDKYFMPDLAYHFYIVPREGEHGSYDPKIADVVTVVIEEFFSVNTNVMLYICDPTDDRQAARNRLYRMWYLGYAMNHDVTLLSDSVTFDGVKYFTGILLRHDHPNHDAILSDYQSFLRYAEQHYSVRRK